MNIGKTLKSLNNLISKKQRKRISRHTKFMKQQKRTLVKTLKQDKMYRRQLHNFQEDMFNSTITRINNKKTKKNGKLHDVQNSTVVDGENSFQSVPDSSPIREPTNVTIIISKVVIDSTSQPVSGDDESSLESTKYKLRSKRKAEGDHNF